MEPGQFRFGFRVLGPATERRRLVDHAAAFLAHAECDPRAKVDAECYLSAFAYDDHFAVHLEAVGSPRGYAGTCWSPWLWIDIDRDDFQVATGDTRKLVLSVVDRWNLEGNELLLFFSGRKGFHVALPLAKCGSPMPSTTFNTQCRRLAEQLALEAGIAIDVGVYDKVRLFRAPNSRHPKTGLHKRLVRLEELLKTSPEGLIERAAGPLPFEVPPPTTLEERAASDWQAAGEVVGRRAAAKATATGEVRLNNQTLAFIREGATAGDRHRLLYSAARNLAEAGCPVHAIQQLLTEPALDAGLPPGQVRRQIECGVADAKKDPS